VELLVPALPRFIPDADQRVFDAWSWCESDVLEWRLPPGKALDRSGRVDATNPPDLTFVMHAECTFLPRELACLHARGYGLSDEWALAPYAIDDATDLLYERRTRPRDVLWLAAPSVPALMWGLHDWAHFHNHGPFDEPAATELQCDLVALAWLRLNAARIGLTDAEVGAVRDALVGLSRRRFEAEDKEPPVPDLDEAFRSAYALREAAPPTILA
jgi:hypothetical protein